MFLHHSDRKLLQSHLSVLVSLLLLTHVCKGQSELIGSSQPIVATRGKDVVLPCYLKPPQDVSDSTLEWTKRDMDPRFVHVWRSGQELEGKKHPSFEGRTSLFISEVNVGNVSLELSRVKLSDQGTYKCFIPTLRAETFVQLLVGSDVVSSPVVMLSGIDDVTGGVVLQCESAGWHPEPEVLWLDGGRNFLPDGRTETVRRPDGLFTVSSRVTVETRHSNNFTCRVQQKNINQIRETQIHVPDVFFKVQSCSAVTAGLAVCSAVCFLLVLSVVFLLWRQNRIKTKKIHREETDEGEKKKKEEEKKNGSKSNKTEDQFVTEEERETEPLRTDETGQIKDKNKKGKGQKKEKCVKIKKTDLQQLREEKQNLKEELEELKKNKQLERSRNTSGLYGLVSQSDNNQESADRKKCCDANEELKKTTALLDQTKRHADGLMADVKKLREEKERSEKELQRLQQELENKNKNKEFEKKLQEETMMKKLQEETMTKNLQEETTKREEAEKEVKNLKKKLEADKEKNSDHKSQDKNRCEVMVNPQRDDTNSVSQSSTSGLVVEVDQKTKRFHLRNTSSQDQQLGGWKLQIQNKYKHPIIHRLKNQLLLRHGQTFTIGSPSQRGYSSTSDLVLDDLKNWNFQDKLQVSLISITEEIQHLPVL